MEPIKGFSGKYRWLSNFHLCLVGFEGLVYPSTENAYQAAKVENNYQRKEFLIISPNKAKELGGKVGLRADWDKIKIDIMRKVLESKFRNDLYLQKLLIETGDAYLEETNDWDDKFWGVCDGVGENNLGKLLMELREGLK